MTNFFLKIKHWQLFLLLFTIPIIWEIYLNIQVISTMSEIMNGGNPDPDAMMKTSIQTAPLLWLSGIVLFAYILTLIRSLNKAKPAELRKELTFPIFCLTFPTIYIAIINILIFSNLDKLLSIEETLDPGILFKAIPIILPCHFFAIFCFFYVIYHLAGSIKCVELRKEISWEEKIPEFIMFWFLPIGIWFLQPRINKIIEGNE